MAKEYIKINYTGVKEDHDEIFLLQNGNRILINRGIPLNIINQLRLLNIDDLFELMQISNESLESFYLRYRNEIRKQIIEYINQSWHWKETGETVDFNAIVNEVLFGKKLNKSEFIKHLTSSKTSLTVLSSYKNVFSIDGDLYQPDKTAPGNMAGGF